MRKIFLVLGFVTLTTPAIAEEKSVPWEPQGCEFRMSFPEAPFVEKKCPDGADKPCHDVATYTQVVNTSSRATIRVSCQTRNAQELTKLNDDTLKQLVSDMAQEARLPSDNISLTPAGESPRVATILGIGSRNEVDVVYTGQVWVGQNSILRLDAEMSGPQNQKVDEVFSMILKSLTAK
jgi:hypothetical protein